MTQKNGDTATKRLGLIGCGAIARLHVQRLIPDPRARITSLFDRDRSAAERLNEELHLGAQIYGSETALVDGVPLDAAIVCTPTLFHFDQVRECRRRGLHVLCEKPLADTRERIVQLIEEVRTGPVVSVAYQRRHSAVFRTLRREVQSGRWGPIHAVTTHNSERWQQTISGTWRDDPRLNPGGFLGDAGSHKIDMLFFVTGLNVTEVAAHSESRGSQVQIATTVSGKLAGNVALSMSFIGNAQHWREDFHVHCREADLAIRDNSLWIARGNRFEPYLDLEPDSSPDAAFLDLLSGTGTNDAPPDCALPVFDFTQAVLESARTGRIVRL